jgi:hypothetical protein
MTAMTEFAELEKGAVRDYWDDEAHDFTPWLADRIDDEDPSKVEDLIGLDLTLKGTEQSVGKYSLDILAEATDGRTVVIENQLEASDHDHLGKCLAYASGVDADIILWLSPMFNDEHSDAFQWLNDHTQEGVDLFAIRLEVWQIGDSNPAVQFSAVEEPSEWKAQAQMSTELTDTEKAYLGFWTDFRNAIEDTDTPLSARKPYAENWYNNPIGRSDMMLQFKVSVRDKMAAAQLVIDDNAEAFEALREESEAIAREVDGNIEWHPVEESPDRSNRSRITVKREANVAEEDKWPEHHDWLLQRGTELYDALGSRVRELPV